MTRAPLLAVVLAAALAGCGVKAAPRPPELPGSEPLDRRGAGAPPRAASTAEGAACGCALPDPLLAGTTKRT